MGWSALPSQRPWLQFPVLPCIYVLTDTRSRLRKGKSSYSKASRYAIVAYLDVGAVYAGPVNYLKKRNSVCSQQ